MFIRIWRETRPTTSTMFVDDYFTSVLGKHPLFNEQKHVDSGDIISETSTSDDGLVRTYTIKFKSAAALLDYRVRWSTEGSTDDQAGITYMDDNGHLRENGFSTQLEQDWC